MVLRRDQLLHLSNSSGPVLRFENTDTTIVGGNSFGSIEFESRDSSVSAGVVAKIEGFAPNSMDGSSANGGAIRFSTATVNPVSLAERMRIDSSGKIQVTGTRGGSLQPSDNDSLELYTSATSGSANTGSGLTFYNHDSSGFEMGGTIQVLKENGTANNTASYMRFATRTNGSSAAERMRIDSSGRLLLGSSSQIGTGGKFQVTSAADTSIFKCTSTTTYAAVVVNVENNAARLIAFQSGSGTSPSLVGHITTNGSTTAYNTSSDYRLKENVINIVDGITRVKQLSPRRFNFIADADTTVDGFIAHEAQAVVPEAVAGEKDGEQMQGIDQSKLVPLLTAALQEAIAKIETLEQRLTDAGIA